MKNPTKSARGGEILYSAPELEVLRIDVEQGFSMSVKGGWENSLDPKRTWDYTNEENLFY